MESVHFCYWLQGFFEIANPSEITAEQTDEILMIPIKINNNQYFFKNISGGENSYAKSIFYKEVIKEKIVKKRKYFFFGKVISEKIVKKNSLKYCFSFIPINLNNFPNNDDMVTKLKIFEENYQRKSNLLNGKISI